VAHLPNSVRCADDTAFPARVIDQKPFRIGSTSPAAARAYTNARPSPVMASNRLRSGLGPTPQEDPVAGGRDAPAAQGSRRFFPSGRSFPVGETRPRLRLDQSGQTTQKEVMALAPGAWKAKTPPGRGRPTKTAAQGNGAKQKGACRR
jgi:hypothetical protein